MIFHVSVNGCDRGNGTEDRPFRTIGKAASIALPGDTVKIHAGVYREWVSPANGGTEDHRIVYEAAGDGEAVISGAEIEAIEFEKFDVIKLEVFSWNFFGFIIG